MCIAAACFGTAVAFAPYLWFGVLPSTANFTTIIPSALKSKPRHSEPSASRMKNAYARDPEDLLADAREELRTPGSRSSVIEVAVDRESIEHIRDGEGQHLHLRPLQTPRGTALRIDEFEYDSILSRAGFHVGDEIDRINGGGMEDPWSYSTQIITHARAGSVFVDLTRNGRHVGLYITWPAESPR